MNNRNLLKKIQRQLNSLLMEMKSDMNVEQIKNSKDKELLFDHSLCHTYWSRLKQDKPVSGWGKSKIIRMHTAIVTEMFKRDFKHIHRSDLDDTLPSTLKTKTDILTKKVMKP